MTYVGVGQTISTSKLRAVTKTAATALPVIAGTCRVGRQGPGITAWDTTGDTLAGRVASRNLTVERPWVSASAKSYFRDHALYSRCGHVAERHGTPSCDPRSKGGRPVPVKTWTDAEYLAVKGTDSMLRFKAQRVTDLLRRLVLPQYGFPMGLDAYAYDASFCRPVTVMPQLRAASIRTLGLMNRYYPRDRWVRVADAVALECEAGTARLSQWRRPGGSPSPCLEPIMKAPSYCEYGNRDINRRLIPVSAALMVRGGLLGPTPWLKSLIECFTPTWLMKAGPSAIKQMAKFPR